MGETAAQHWDTVYATRAPGELSWFQAEPTTSIQLLTSALPELGSVIDIGAGASTLADSLLDAGWSDVTVLDVSREALALDHDRLDARESTVTFIVADVLTWHTDRTYDAWHDRAVFHFLVRDDDRENYVAQATRAVRPGGVLVLATFAADGPTHCSGLPTARYDADSLAAVFAPGFTLEHSEREEHVTPSGVVQPFTWVVLRRASGWLLDEVSSAGRENLDPGHVSRYDSKEEADSAAEVSLLRSLGLTPESVVVDLGAGTGQLALAVAPACARVVAVDVSPVMLNALRAKVDRSGLDNVEVIQAGFLTYDHQGSPADFVYSRYALHHLPDFWKGVALARLHSMLRPGGAFRLWDVVYNFDPADAADRIAAWCATGNAPEAGGWSRDELEEHVRDEHSTYSWLLEELLRRTGFAIEDAEYSDDGIFGKYVLRRA